MSAANIIPSGSFEAFSQLTRNKTSRFTSINHRRSFESETMLVTPYTYDFDSQLHQSRALWCVRFLDPQGRLELVSAFADRGHLLIKEFPDDQHRKTAADRELQRRVRRGQEGPRRVSE